VNRVIKTGEPIFLGTDYDLVKSSVNKMYLTGFDDAQRIWSVPQGTIGTVSIDHIDIEIIPSISYLTSYDYIRLLIPEMVGNADNGMSGLSRGPNLSFVIIDLFRTALAKLTEAGLPRKYGIKRIETNRLEGNVNWVESYIREKQLYDQSIISDSDTLTSNYMSMLVIKAAYEKSKLVKSTANINNLDIALRHIPNKTFAANNLPSNLYFHKNEGLLQSCYEYALLILSGSKINNLGKNKCTLLINANSLFQKFIWGVISVQAINGATYANYPIPIGSTARPILFNGISDFMIKGSSDLPVDAKNKNFYDRANLADIYQIISYCHSLDSNAGILVYPKCDDEENIEQINISGSKPIKIYRIGINLSSNKSTSLNSSKSGFIKSLNQITTFA
jgi:5-methylcytosine-specific restriction endonuclease McrBC regulatory subunit McrC